MSQNLLLKNCDLHDSLITHTLMDSNLPSYNISTFNTKRKVIYPCAGNLSFIYIFKNPIKGPFLKYPEYR